MCVCVSVFVCALCVCVSICADTQWNKLIACLTVNNGVPCASYVATSRIENIRCREIAWKREREREKNLLCLEIHLSVGLNWIDILYDVRGGRKPGRCFICWASQKNEHSHEFGQISIFFQTQPLRRNKRTKMIRTLFKPEQKNFREKKVQAIKQMWMGESREHF